MQLITSDPLRPNPYAPPHDYKPPTALPPLSSCLSRRVCARAHAAAAPSRWPVGRVGQQDVVASPRVGGGAGGVRGTCRWKVKHNFEEGEGRKGHSFFLSTLLKADELNPTPRK